MVGFGAIKLSKGEEHKKSGLLIAALACIPWIIFGIMSGSIWTCVANIVFGAIYLKGWLQHGKDRKSG